MTEKALRFNTGKPKLSMYPTNAMIEVTKVWEKGLEKYPKDNWKQLYGPETIPAVLDSALRHIIEMLDGNHFDKESGLLHAAHAICNLQMAIEWYYKEGLVVRYNHTEET